MHSLLANDATLLITGEGLNALIRLNLIATAKEAFVGKKRSYIHFTPTPLYCLLLLLSYIYQRLWRVSEEEESDTGSVSSDEGVGDMAEERSLELE